ncbi:winged helix-turn-helix transcriptional regulator [Kitasatospora sp. NBC_01287]|uniref:winged helix-turn-helix transcriptional regulator n=1 Tax=Kitasatospora sp. NBC_01287 TaxID=2903573 RepID=UPI00224D83D3|nr:winged helix-turn-helix transcriptional regulator [Kitasatospora sp. NBC_01287]
MLSHPDWSDRRIAGTSGLATKTVAALRRAMRDLPAPARRVGRDGRARPVVTAEGRFRAAELIREDPSLSLREIARQAGISPGTARDVKQRLLQGLDPVPAGRRQEPRGDGADQLPPEVSAALEERRRLLMQLSRDPSLRHSHTGRSLLRMLITHHAEAEAWQQLAAAVPPHNAPAILLLARNCAADWAGLAEHIETLMDQHAVTHARQPRAVHRRPSHGG